jgi:NADPH-dependent 2,4-dienoyl-CoA reductase/sulfur reductase-like enzyme
MGYHRVALVEETARIGGNELRWLSSQLTEVAREFFVFARSEEREGVILFA